MSGPHPSHKIRFSDASTFDNICEYCGATDHVPGGWGDLAFPCTNVPVPIEFPGAKYVEPGILQMSKRYAEGGEVLVVVHAGGDETKISVNLSDVWLGRNEIAIKDYSENTGVLDALIETKVVSPPTRFVESGHVAVPICTMLKTIA